jgi:hypothetical protein
VATSEGAPLRTALPYRPRRATLQRFLTSRTKRNSARLYDGVVDVAQNDRGGVFLMSTVPARPFPRRTPRPDGLPTIVDGK